MAVMNAILILGMIRHMLQQIMLAINFFVSWNSNNVINCTCNSVTVIDLQEFLYCARWCLACIHAISLKSQLAT